MMVLWLLGLLSIMVTAYAVTVSHQITTASLNESMVNSEINARSALEAWLTQFKSDITPDLSSGNNPGIVVSEVMPYWPDPQLKITRVSYDSPEFVEVFNAMPENLKDEGSPAHLTFRLWGSETGPMTEFQNITVSRNEYFLLCPKGTNVVLGENCDGHYRGSLANQGEGFRIQSLEGKIYDAVGPNSVPEFHEGTPINSPTNAIERKQNSTDNSPRDTEENLSDFSSQTFTSGDLKSGFSARQLGGSLQKIEKNEYIEIANFGDTVDPVALNYQVFDTKDGKGDTFPGNGRNQYFLTTYPGYPNSSNTTLGKNQVGLILPVTDVNGERDSAADTHDLGVAEMANSGEIQLYALSKSGSPGHQFLTGGICDIDYEQIFLKGPGFEQDVVPNLPEACPNDNCPIPAWLSLNNTRPTITDDQLYWNFSDRHGSPGRVEDGFDAFADRQNLGTDQWGWTGNLIGSAQTSDSIYVPSLETSRQPGDVGVFEVMRIEDESGKHDLKSPPSLTALTSEVSLDRTLSNPIAQNVITKSDSVWMTTGDLLDVSGVNTTNYDHFQHSYSVHRKEGPEGDRININTASYEALRGIQISSNPGTTPAYVTDEMAKDIIERRSGSNQSVSDPDNDGYYELNEEVYDGGTPRPFYNIYNVEDLQSFENTPSFNNFTFLNFATVRSEGIFTVYLRGIHFNAIGRENGETVYRAVVRRERTSPSTSEINILSLTKE